MATIAPTFDPYAADRERLTRRRKMAEMLMQQGFEPGGNTQVVSGVAVQNSPLQGLAKIAQIMAGKKGLESASQEEMEIGERRRADVARAMSDFSGSVAPQPGERIEVGPTMEGPATETQMPPQPAPLAARRMAVARALASPHPELQRVAEAELKMLEHETPSGGARLAADTQRDLHGRASGSAMLGAQTADRDRETRAALAREQQGLQRDLHREASGSAQLAADTQTTLHGRPSGSAVLGAQTQRFMHTRPSGSAQLSASVQREVLGETKRHNTATEQAKLAENKLGKPPAGFRWAEDGMSLEPIPGGPGEHIAGESAAKVALAETGKVNVQGARNVFLDEEGKPRRDRIVAANVPTGVGGIPWSEGRTGRQQIRLGIESALRLATGAAAPETEVARYESMFLPQVTDTDADIKRKMDTLEDFLGNTNKYITRGRGSVGTGAPAKSSGASGGWKVTRE